MEPYDDDSYEEAMTLLAQLRKEYDLANPPCCTDEDVALMYWYMKQRRKQAERIAELKAEVGRLRGALTRISMMNDHNFRHGDLMNEAKAALESKE